MQIATGAAVADTIGGSLAWDLIIVGSRGQTGLKCTLLGSVARNVLSGSDASVLVVRAAPEA